MGWESRVGARSSPVYAFAGFELDPAVCELRLGGREVPLEPKPFDLLLYLIRHRGRVVGKLELRSALWGGMAVSEGVLTRGIWAARKAVRDDGVRQVIIKTVRGRGYRFVAPIEELAGPDGSDGSSR